jgi:ABC-2 type transport system ATP-binding protein
MIAGIECAQLQIYIENLRNFYEYGHRGILPSMTSSSTLALEIKDVRKTYLAKGKPPVDAVKDVSLSIEKGEFFGLLGPNGAGKTSLISMIAGLAVKSAGTISICGVSVDEDAPRSKTFLGLVPQEFNFSIFEKVINIVLDQAGYYGISKEEALPYAEEILKKLGLWEKKDSPAQELSGGMKRRLMIARALIHKPQVLLLDEPTAGVDVELRRSMWDFLRELNAAGTTIVLTTHYLEEAEALCRQVAIIQGGLIIKQGSVKELLASLTQVTLILDTLEPVTDAALHLLKDLGLIRIDEKTFELTLHDNESINNALRKMSLKGMQVINIRNKGSRLEEVFVRLIENPA